MIAPLQAKSLSDITSVRHGFFTRKGGVSEGLYSSLNAGLGSADNKIAVLQNRSRIAAYLGARDTGINTTYQIHSTTAVVVDKPLEFDRLPRADALVTKTPGLAIGVLAADCAPVLFVDPVASVVAAAHAGWRGALDGILEATIATMEGIGAQRKNIIAAIGPCINQPAYEVGPEFYAKFEAANTDNAVFFSRATHSARPHFDLPGYIYHKLKSVPLASVEQQSPCTYQNESDFFSFRRTTHHGEPDYGRHISAIVLAQR